MESPVKRRSVSLDTSDWSDPRDGAISSSAPPVIPSDELGIAIPEFLQPLLGLDFVPYLPRTVDTSATSSDATRLTDEYLDDLDLLGPCSSRQTPTTGQLPDHSRSQSGLVRRPVQRSKSLGPSASEPNFLESLKSPVSGGPSQEDALASNSVKRSWRPPGGNLIHKVRGKIEEKRVERQVRKERRRSLSRTRNGSGGSPVKSKRGSKENGEALEWIQEQNLRLANHQSHLEEVHLEAQVMTNRANEIYKRVGDAQNEILRLQKALVLTENRMRRDMKELDDTRGYLNRLQTDALRASQALVDSIQQMQIGNATSSSDSTGPSDQTSQELLFSGEEQIPVEEGSTSTLPLRRRAATAPSAIRVDSFMRVDDLDIDDATEYDGVRTDGGTSKHSSESSRVKSPVKQNGLIFVDNNIATILHNLTKLGYRIAIDESSRFTPTRDTERLLVKYAQMSLSDNSLDEWPLSPWKCVHGHDILVWTGDIGHRGFGSDWPVVKARCLVETSPRCLVDFMMDSSRIKEYNKMSQGREDMVQIQQGLDTTEEESIYGFAGDCKIVRALNKPRLLPKNIETLSLTYSQPLSTAPGSYMTVTRSVFEDSSGEHKSPSANTIRSEMLLGVNIYRPANLDHSVTEFTSITHMFSPGVPEVLARRAAPASAYNMMKDIQSVFLKPK